MDDEAKQLLREIRDLSAAAHAQNTKWIAESREMSQRAISYNRNVWRLSLALIIAVPVVFVIAVAVGFLIEHYSGAQ